MATSVGKALSSDMSKQGWVQTEKQVHIAWMLLGKKDRNAADLMHLLVALSDKQSAVVTTRKVLAVKMDVSESTIKRALNTLREDRWIETVQIGGKGGINAYVINSRVAWSDSRENLKTASFTATVVADYADQKDILDGSLVKVPTIVSGGYKS